MFSRGVDNPMQTMHVYFNIEFELKIMKAKCSQGVRNVRLSDVFRRIKREHWEEKG